MNISNAEYLNGIYDGEVNVAINFTLDGKVYCCPTDPNNTHYAEIMRQVEANELTIQDAD